MKAIHSRSMILLLLIFIQACVFNTGTPLAAETVAPKTSLVLDATDLLDISDLQLENIDLDQLPGRYISEQGGSVLYLNITPQTKDSWIVERVYTEPSMQNMSKKYTIQKTEFGLADKKGNLIVRQTSEGLIAFENNSELDAIPRDYWIHYIKQE